MVFLQLTGVLGGHRRALVRAECSVLLTVHADWPCSYTDMDSIPWWHAIASLLG